MEYLLKVLGVFKFIKEKLAKLAGLRTALVALLLLAEPIAQRLGYATGPLFAALNTLFQLLGITSPDAGQLVGDPSLIVTAGATLYFAFRRIQAYYFDKPASEEIEEAGGK